MRPLAEKEEWPNNRTNRTNRRQNTNSTTKPRHDAEICVKIVLAVDSVMTYELNPAQQFWSTHTRLALCKGVVRG